jgi:hypothetical protein
MAVSRSPFFPGNPISDVVTIPSGSSTAVTLYTAPAEGAIIKNVWVHQKGSTARAYTLEIVKSATAYTVATYTIPATQNLGTELITPDKVPMDVDGGLMLGGGHSLRITPANVAAAQDVTIQGATYAA